MVGVHPFGTLFKRGFCISSQLLFIQHTAEQMQILLRRKLRIIHPMMTLYGLKLLCDLNPHMGRKWRVQNSKALSQLYRYVTPSVPEVCASVFGNTEPIDTSVELPVPAEQRDTEEHMQRVCQEYGNLEYPTLKPYS